MMNQPGGIPPQMAQFMQTVQDPQQRAMVAKRLAQQFPAPPPGTNMQMPMPGQMPQQQPQGLGAMISPQQPQQMPQINPMQAMQMMQQRGMR
jgi:hypothetical protein